MYRVGLPFWKAVARAGKTVKLRVEIEYDPEANVYCATSPDLRGLVVEADSLDDLMKEVPDAVDMLMTAQLHGGHIKTISDYRYLDACPA